ncbi:MAG: hypothetical protein GF317_19095 [Candidatus Lokiarchaeota archaeon]|nr:hypothetical protein [Candidatus Lokiarchaeota archaeon]MBD3201619.1 hypothetical protein [Candidatus Lokiarchaeota archaeon]
MKNNEAELLEEISEEKDFEKFQIDFISSGAIVNMDLKFLIMYIPIFWVSLFIVFAFWYNYFIFLNILLQILLIPIGILSTFFIIAFGVAISGKLIYIILILLHYPKEGIFPAVKGNKDYNYWCLRVQLKKLVLWIMNNTPLPWIDTWGFRWFGVKVDFSSHMFDAWMDTEFIEFGRKVTIGQGAVVMSSMIVGDYLIIKKVKFDDYSVIGGVSNVAPGTHVGEDTVIGAFSSTKYNQELESGWIYFGIPASKLKENKYAEMRRNIIYKKDVDQRRKYKIEHGVNIDHEEETE